jgi:UDP-glucose:(heptosyl)LPS alpha-1,3-glucosyltransferase
MMKMAFLLNEYRPFGGMPRDCVHLAREAASRGHSVTIVTRSWQGDRPDIPGLEIVLMGKFGLTNFQRDQRFIRAATAWVDENPQDLVLGFLRMPGLDAYFASDPCFEAKARRLRSWWFRLTPRYHRFAHAESAVYDSGLDTQILLLHPGETPHYQDYYGTETSRLHVLPPGIKRPDPDAELGIPSSAPMLLLAGSGFRTKGLDRALIALATLLDAHLVIAGQDKSDPFRKKADQLGIGARVHFLGGRSDLDRLMLASDLLIHPAYSENTGTVLIEALVLGLPVVATAVCGFASHLQASECGVVLAEPFSQSKFNDVLKALLKDAPLREMMRRAGSAYGVSEDLYSCHQRAVDLLESFSEA